MNIPPNKDDFKTVNIFKQINNETGIEEDIEKTVFDGKAFIKALQEYNTNKLKNMDIVENNTEENNGCNTVFGEQIHNLDILLKFKISGNNTIECITLNTFLTVYINNICNIYIRWLKKDDNNERDDDKLIEGYGYAPKYNINEIQEMIKNNDKSILEQLYWQLPLFGTLYLNLDALLKIQDIIIKSKKVANIELTNINNNDLRIGNLYGSFGVGQIHGQKNVIQLYSPIYKDDLDFNNLQPYFFKTDILYEKLNLQTSIIDDARNLNIENLTNEFLFDEKDICPFVETEIYDSFSIYNDQLKDTTFGAIENIYNSSTVDRLTKIFLIDKAIALIEKIKDLRETSLSEMRKIIINNSDILSQVTQLLGSHNSTMHNNSGGNKYKKLKTKQRSKNKKARTKSKTKSNKSKTKKKTT